MSERARLAHETTATCATCATAEIVCSDGLGMAYCSLHIPSYRAVWMIHAGELTPDDLSTGRLMAARLTAAYRAGYADGYVAAVTDDVTAAIKAADVKGAPMA